MGFSDKYATSLMSCNLRNDATHHDTDALAASALAERRTMGGLLHRVKAGGDVNALRVLQREWTRRVVWLGLEREWYPAPINDWDVKAAQGFYLAVAERSLAHWLHGHCKVCNGTAIAPYGKCMPCEGTGQEPLTGAANMVERVREMVGELQGFEVAHARRAESLLGRRGFDE